MIHTTVCEPTIKNVTPYSLLNTLLGQLRFTTVSALTVIDTDANDNVLGLMFALNGGVVVSPNATDAHFKLFAAFRHTCQLPGLIGVRNGMICRQPVYASSIAFRRQVW